MSAHQFIWTDSAEFITIKRESRHTNIIWTVSLTNSILFSPAKVLRWSRNSMVMVLSFGTNEGFFFSLLEWLFFIRDNNDMFTGFKISSQIWGYWHYRICKKCCYVIAHTKNVFILWLIIKNIFCWQLIVFIVLS